MEDSRTCPEPVVMRMGKSRVVVTAIHDGHAVRPEFAALMKVSAQDRLREEDPFTGDWARLFPTSVVSLRSRFEFDLNRARDAAVYRTESDAWGIRVWENELTDGDVETLLTGYDRFYREISDLLDSLVSDGSTVAVMDLHSYNHRRSGPSVPADDPGLNPDINIGTGWIDRDFWAPVVDAAAQALNSGLVNGRRLDVRENIRFRGGWFPRWIAERYGRRVCPIAIEVKKIFMDEWTGELHPDTHARIGDLLLAAAESVDKRVAALASAG